MRVHPAADVFPMLSDDELDALGADILANGLTSPIVITIGPDGKNWLVDGRNRLEAIERKAGGIHLDPERHIAEYAPTWEQVPAYVISANIHRRHLTKQQQADLIVAAIKAGEACRQVGEVPQRHVKGKAGSTKDAVKEAAVASAAEHGISKRTVERSIAKAEGREPKPKAKPSEDEERDGKECIALYQKVCEAERELARAEGRMPRSLQRMPVNGGTRCRTQDLS